MANGPANGRSSRILRYEVNMSGQSMTQFAVPLATNRARLWMTPFLGMSANSAGTQWNVAGAPQPGNTFVVNGAPFNGTGFGFNPAAGVTQKFTSQVTGYVGYAEGNRAPTAGEIECSDPAKPCLLPSSLSSDPPTLRQVVARTWEAGLRGKSSSGDAHSWEINWNAGLFRTDVRDDIYGVATSLSSGYFQNIGGTRRQGVELGLHYQEPRCSVFVSYSYVAATFQSTLLLPSPQNSHADAQGNIHVRPGDYLPGIPTHRLKLGADVPVTPAWLVGGDLQAASQQYLGGDESNQMPALPSYAVINMHSSYEFNERVQMYAHIVNLTNRRYSIFGELGDPTGIGAPGIPADADTNDPRVDNRFVSPAQPFSVYAGVRIRY
jgi:iron complex outermembrane receptor protein